MVEVDRLVFRIGGLSKILVIFLLGDRKERVFRAFTREKHAKNLFLSLAAAVPLIGGRVEDFLARWGDEFQTATALWSNYPTMPSNTGLK